MFEENFGFERWVDYILDVPMYFLKRDGKYLDFTGKSFKKLLLQKDSDFKIHFKGKFRIRYRGKSDYRQRYFREPNHCLQKYATSFAIYPISEESYKEVIGGLK